MAHIIVVIDKSGSMGLIAPTVISGFNEFLQSQKQVVDNSTLTLIEFSDRVNVVFSNRAIADVPQLTPETYHPDGMTALNDAIGETISNHNTTNQTLVVIITDGEENSSTRFKVEQIQELIQQRTAVGWRFIYLCNNLQTATAGAAVGLASATRGMCNPATQNLMANESNFGAVLSRQVSAAACAYRVTNEVTAVDELSSNISQMNITPPKAPSRVHPSLVRSSSSVPLPFSPSFGRSSSVPLPFIPSFGRSSSSVPLPFIPSEAKHPLKEDMEY